ncbi:MAG: RecX family transcriptional regulator [Treponema sp.]|jgi:regulatory protein|nr:RecX family transcriptional regulator [Treponema sp.]
MNILKIKAENTPKVYRIALSDGRLFSIKTVYLKEDFISGMTPASPPFEISEDKDAELHFASACLRAERAALSLIANAEQTRLGLGHKLRARGYTSSCVKAVVDHLSSIEAVNDERYAGMWVRSWLSLKSDGPNKLFAKLRAKGISCGTVQKVLKATLDFETELALLKKFAAKNRIDAESFRTRRQRLKYAGFSAEVVQTLEEEEDG